MRRVLALALAVLVGCGARISIGELEGEVADAGPTPVRSDDAGSLPDGSDQDGGAAYDPCEGKACGAACALCAPWDTGCAETATPKQCDSKGACTDSVVTCEAIDGGGAYDPCAGKACGDPCTQCPPFDPGCVEPAVLKECNAAGVCSGTPATCS